MSLLKQTTDKPLFPDVLWNRPENKRYAGKLLIIGGHATSLSAPAVCFSSAISAGIGTARVILPDSTQKILGKSFHAAEFANSNPSGSFSQSALGQILDAADWADAVLLAGDFGKNSETAILVEKFIKNYKGKLAIAGDSADALLQSNTPLLSRVDTFLVAEFSKLQKLGKNNFPKKPLLNSLDVTKTSEVFAEWTQNTDVGFLTEHNGQIIISLDGKVSTTPADGKVRVEELAGCCGVWWIQQGAKPFEAVTTAVYDYLKSLTSGAAGRT